MLKNTFILTGLCALPILNEFIKTQVTKTASFKKTITQIQNELKEIDINLSNKIKENSQDTQELEKNSEELEILYDLILTPEVEKYLSKKSKNKIEIIRRLKSDQSGNIKLAASISSVNLIGSFVHMPFFYYSIIGYTLFSQFSLINDLFTIKTGNQLVTLPFKSIAELYLKGSIVVLAFFSMKAGVKKLVNMSQTKEIVKKD